MNDYSRVCSVVTIVAAILASGCSAAPSAPPTAVTTPKSQAMPAGDQELRAGTYVYAFTRLDSAGKPFPNVSITLPDGWTSYGGFAVQSQVDTPRQMAVAFWTVSDVYANSCHWVGSEVHPGPTVDDLAAVLKARPLRNATAPVAVGLGGYTGKYLEWSVPASISFADCDRGSFQSWYSSDSLSDAVGPGERYQQGPGQIDQLWILNVEGRRMVIDANFMPGATAQDRASLAAVVSSIAFTSRSTSG